MDANTKSTALDPNRDQSRIDGQVLTSVLQHTHIKVSYLDLRFNYVWVNPAYAASSRHEAAFFPGKNQFVLYPDAETQAIFQRVVETGKPIIKAAQPFHFPDQPERGLTYWDWDLIPIKDAADKVQGLLSLSEDVTDRIRSAEALRESETRFGNLLQDVQHVAVQGYGPDGTTQYWNRASERLYGFRAQEAIGRNLVDLIIPPDMREPVSQAIRYMAESGIPIPASELSLMRKDGSRVPVFSSHTLVQMPGRPQELFCVDIDLTGLKRAEEEKSSLEGQLLQAQKMESIGRLAGGVAHDFNNMLQAILGSTEMVLAATDPDDPRYADLKEILAAAQRSTELTRQLLAFARKQPIAPKTLNLNETIAALFNMLARLIGENIGLTVCPDTDPWSVQMDPTQVDQLLTNLVVNARDAIGGVGKVSIATGKAEFDDLFCRSHVDVRPGAYVLLSVSDTGCGMEPETLSRIFEPFFTTKPAGQGTGLGLSTVYGIVKQNSGFIQVQSEPGQGTTFKVFLPRHVADAPLPAPAPAPAPLQPGTETVLLVEDEPALLHLAHRLLDALGYRVIAAESPIEALRLAGAYAGEIHLLLTDVIMPEMSGSDLCDRLGSSRPRMKCLFMSGFTADTIARHAGQDDGPPFIQKPFTKQTLAVKIREALGTRPAAH